MKEKVFITVCFLALTMTGIAQSIKTHKIEIDRDMYEFIEVNGHLHILPVEEGLYDYNFEKGRNFPAILYKAVQIVLPEQEKLKNISISAEDCSQMADVILPKNPGVMPMDTNSEEMDAPYEIKDYPFDFEYWEYGGNGYRRTVTVFFSIFAYNAITKTVSWPKSLNFTIETEPLEQWEYVSWAMPSGWSLFEEEAPYINPEDFWEEKKMPSIIGSVWSYVNYETASEGEEMYDFFRYTVLDEPKDMDGQTYYPMVKYTTCEYIPGEETSRVYLREEGCKIYKYLEQEGEETLLYNFAIQPYDKYFFENQHDLFKTVNGNAIKISEQEKCMTAEDGFPFRKMTVGNMTWIDGIGNVRDFLAENNTEVGASVLNYYRSGDGRVVYKNALEGKEGIPEFQENDGAIIDEKQSRHPIALEGKTWNLNHVYLYTVPYYYEGKQWIEGDTLVDGIPCKKLYTLTTTEDERVSQKRKLEVGYCRQEGEKFYKDGVLMYDFGMKEGELFSFGEETYAIVTHVGDTTLTDGITRKCLTLKNYYPEWNIVGMASDKWIEGIGSLKRGIYENLFMGVGGFNTTLLSCTHNNTVIYEKEPEEAMPSRPQPALPAGMEEVPFGEALYLMNVGTKQFLTGGGQWETQAYAGEEGWKVRLKKHQKAGLWDGKTVVLEDSIVTDRANGWRKAYFYTHGNAVFTDGLSQADTLWVLHQMGGGRYRLSASQKNMTVQDEGRFVGVDGGSGSMALTSNLTGGNAQEMVDWIFLDKTGYEAYLTEIATYRLAQELKQLIDEAAAKGIDVTPQNEVYQDPTASAEEIEKACAAVRQLLIADEEKQVKADNPADKTSWITNAGYADKKAGWSDTDDRWTVQDGVAEHYGHTFNHYQTISDIPNGLYKVTVQGVYRAKANAGHPEEYAAFYAISGNDSIAKPLPERRMGATEKPLTDYNVSGESYGYVPTAPSAVDAYFKAGKYEVEYYIHVVQNKVRLGVTLPDDYATDWVVWDNWRLTYYGTDTEAYEKGVIAGMAKENMDKYDHLDAATTIGTVDAYKAILTSLAEGEVADINVAEKRIKDAAADVEKNSQAWASYREVIRQAELLVGSPYIVWNDICRKLDDYLKTTVRKHLDERTLTSEEVNKAALELDGMRNDAQSTQIIGNNIKKTWSYVRFDRTGTDEYGNRIESNDYNRYTLFTIPENVGRTTYHKLVNHQTCEYDQEKDAKTYRIRYEGKRIYLLKEDAPDYQETGILLKEEGDDYILYDFGLEVGDEFCKMAYDEDTVSIYVTEISSVATTDGEMRRAFRLSTGPGWIIDGIGSTEDFIHPTGDMLRQTCDCGVVLNLYRESLLGVYPRKEYRNPFGNIIAQSTTFKEDDCALGADAVEQAVTQRTPASVQATGSAILCMAPDAVKLEVYTPDAVKVGETLFANGTATVKVSKAPTIYLYIVTYRDGRRESGKVVMSK